MARTRTKTSTSTSTITKTRLQWITTQVVIALRRASSINKSYLDAIEKAILNQWISKLSIYGLNSDNLCQAQLILKIDWDRHKAEISKGTVTVSIGTEKWIDETAIELDALLKMFNTYVTNENLTTEVRTWYAPDLDEDKLNKELGWKKAEPIQWAKGDILEQTNQIEEMPEMCVGLTVLDL